MNITQREYLDKLDEAPSDHHSDEFVDYLRNNSVNVLETAEWLVVENIKYHKDELPWYTAFVLRDDLTLEYTMQLLQWEFPEYNMIIHAPISRSVKRFHIHLIRIDKKYTV